MSNNTDIKPGDFVYVHTRCGGCEVGEIRYTSNVRSERLLTSSGGYIPFKNVYRLARKGETIPIGTVTARVSLGGLGDTTEWECGKTLEKTLPPIRVIVSKPNSEKDEALKELAELKESAARLEKKIEAMP